MEEIRMTRKSFQIKERRLKGKMTLLIVIVVAMMVVNMILPLRKVYAAVGLQSKPGATSVYATVDYLFRSTREMEASGGTLGLTATFDSTKYTQNNTTNGVDIHMAKNTEWGAAAMLADSQYGLAPSGESDASTTGNNTGIFQMAGGKWEYVAGICDTTDSTILRYMESMKSADTRYYDLYSSSIASSAYKKGDATYETTEWKGTSDALFINSVRPVFVRSMDALFGFGYGNAKSYDSIGSRAVLVVAAGL